MLADAIYDAEVWVLIHIVSSYLEKVKKIVFLSLQYTFSLSSQTIELLD